MKTYKIYKHTNKINGKVYIGITSYKYATTRWAKGNGYSQQSLFYNAIKKYGWNNFDHEILFDELSKEEACEKEIELISFYKSNQREYGYNLASGGGINSGYKLSDETKSKLSNFHKGKHPWNYGIKGYSMPNLKGKRRSDETKRKMSENRPKNAVAQYSIDGKLINMFNSQLEAEKITGVPNTSISLCVRGIHKQAGGFIWKRLNENDLMIME